MVLELKVPHEPDLITLRPLIPVFLSYVLSFIYIGIYWNNHHHLLHAIRHGIRVIVIAKRCRLAADRALEQSSHLQPSVARGEKIYKGKMITQQFP